jgi:hypothetical protein
MRLLPTLWALFLVVAAVALPLRADIPGIDPKQDPLQAVLDRIHEHAAIEAWKQGGFTDETIEKWLDKLVASVATAVEFPELKVPVRLADVKPPPAENPAGNARGRSLHNALIVAKNVDLKNAMIRDSIILADGTVEVDSARGCVIIARGAVTVRSMSTYSVIVSGVYIRIAQFDGEPRNTTNGSLLVSRSRAEIGTPYGSLIVAPDGVAMTRVSSRSDPVFINTPAPPLPRAALAGAAAAMFGQAPPPAPPSGKVVKAPDLPLERMPKHPLSAKIELLGENKSDPAARPGLISPFGADSQGTGVVFRYGGRRYVADLDQPIVDEAGDPVSPLEGWRLTFAAEKFAVLSRDSSDALIEMVAK